MKPYHWLKYLTSHICVQIIRITSEYLVTYNFTEAKYFANNYLIVIDTEDLMSMTATSSGHDFQLDPDPDCWYTFE